MMPRPHYFLIALLFSVATCFGQDDNGDRSDKISVRPSKYSIRMEFSVPNPTNAAWRKSMVGIFETNLAFNYKIAHDLFIGAGYKAGLWYTPPKFFIFDVKTKMQTHSGFLRVGYDIYKRNNHFITPALNAGWTYTKYTKIACVKEAITWKPVYQDWFIEPQITFNFLPDPNFGISGNLSFVIVDHVWDPEFICLQDHINYSEVKRWGLTSYLNIGFGLYWGFGKGKHIAGK